MANKIWNTERLNSFWKSKRLSKLIKRVSDYTLCRPSKLQSLGKIALEVHKRGLIGDFVECGVYNGGSAALVASLLRQDSRIILYDSFQGMPPITDKDGSDAANWIGQCVGDIQKVKEIFSLLNIPTSRLIIREGLFHESFPKPKPEKIAFLHIDADWYESVYLSLITFYPLVVTGGVIVLDDFGYWEGCREAFYDFCCNFGVKPLLERFENDQAFWWKDCTNHRDGWMHVVR